MPPDERSRDDLVEALQRLRVGHAYDVHRFASSMSRPLILGGIRVDGGGGLEGRTDGDVVTHAVTDALVAAVGEGDSGLFYTRIGLGSERDSLQRLGRVAEYLRDRDVWILSVDCTLICERPSLSGSLAEVGTSLSQTLAAPVTVKAKHPEGLGALGRAEGIGCHAIALVFRAP